MTKTPNPTSVSKKVTKLDNKANGTRVSPWFDDYRDLFSLKTKPVTVAFIDRLSEELIQWAHKEDSIVLGDFCDEKGIQPKTLSRWMERSPELADAYEFARRRVVSRREKGGMTRKFDPGFILNTMPMIDPTWREFIQWKSSLKHQEENNQKVVIEISDLSQSILAKASSDTKEG